MMVQNGNAGMMKVEDGVFISVSSGEHNSMTVQITLEQLKELVVQGSKILAQESDLGVSKTQYFGGDTQYTVNDY